jgi:hypothetical protein
MAMQWDDRLISRADALEIGGEHPVFWSAETPGDGGGLVLVLRCGGCRRSCGTWHPGQQTDVNDVLAGVLRHLVMAHDVPLNKPARERMTDERDSSGSTDPTGRAGQRPAAMGPGPVRDDGRGVPGADPGA